MKISSHRSAAIPRRRCARSACSATRSSTSRSARRGLRPLHAGDTIPVAPSLDYEAVLAQAAGAVNDMVGLTHDLRQITGGIIDGKGTIGQLMTNRALYDQLLHTLGRANGMLASFENPNGSFGRMLNDPTLYEKFVGVIASADSLVVALNDKNGTIGRLLRDDTLYTHMVSMATAGDSLMKTLSSGQGLAGRLLNDPSALRQAEQADDRSRRDPRRRAQGSAQVHEGPDLRVPLWEVAAHGGAGIPSRALLARKLRRGSAVSGRLHLPRPVEVRFRAYRPRATACSHEIAPT